MSHYSHCNSLMTQDPANAAFQLYTVVTEALVAELPDGLTFEEGSVLPLATSTACAGLYRKDYLGLPLPVVGGAKATGQTILIWGGASSVGATSIQLAVASGLTVLTTASAANHDFVKSLGAHAVFDYRSSNVVQDIVNALANTKFVGVYDAISEDVSFKAISTILDGLNVTVNVASVLPYDKPTERFAPKYGRFYINSIFIFISELMRSSLLQCLPTPSFKTLTAILVSGFGVNTSQRLWQTELSSPSQSLLSLAMDFKTSSMVSIYKRRVYPLRRWSSLFELERWIRPSRITEDNRI